MSSIISDLFYGSKQNILDNYLINRHDLNHQSSLQQKQETLNYASFIEFIIKVTNLTALPYDMQLKVEVEMGNRRDEEVLQIKAAEQQGNQVSSAVLTIQEIEKNDLSKLTNVKITISEGKHEKLHGFIPIETIKSIAKSFSNEKTLLVQMKGKSSLPFTTIQCTIRTQFHSNNILNSEIMRSMEREHESYIKSKHQISQQSSHNHEQNKRTAKNRQSSNNRSGSSLKKDTQPSNIYIDDGPGRSRAAARTKRPQVVTEYVKEIKSFKIMFSKIDLNQNFKQLSDQVNLKVGDALFKANEVIEFKELTSQGVNVDVLIKDANVGCIHLSPLLLTLSKISGELPIYSPDQQCLGTILVQSPNQHQPPTTTYNTNIDQKYAEKHQHEQEESFHQILLLSLDKIILLRTKEDELYNNEWSNFSFSKMQTNKVEVLIRVNGDIHKFKEVMLHYNIDRESMTIVQLRRKQGFTLRYFQQASDELTVEIEIFSAYRLLAYAKIAIAKSDNFIHKFIGAASQVPTVHCGVYLKVIRLQPKSNYFQSHKITTIFNILEELLRNNIILNNINDQQIKRIMNIHAATYVELKKLLMLLDKNFHQFKRFQTSQLFTVYNPKTPEANEKMIKLTQRLLDEFLYVSNNSNRLTISQFQKIVEFYKEDLSFSLEEKWKQYINNPVTDSNAIIYIFFVAGFYFVNAKEPIDQEQKQDESREKPKQQIKQKQNLNKNEADDKGKKEASVKVEPSYFICKISISNAHILNMGKAPNLCLSIARNVSYSNSNPEFNVQKEVTLLDTIKIYHKSIAQNRLIQLAQFQPLRRQTYYELEPSGKCLAKLTWGL